MWRDGRRSASVSCVQRCAVAVKDAVAGDAGPDLAIRGYGQAGDCAFAQFVDRGQDPAGQARRGRDRNRSTARRPALRPAGVTLSLGRPTFWRLSSCSWLPAKRYRPPPAVPIQTPSASAARARMSSLGSPRCWSMVKKLLPFQMLMPWSVPNQVRPSPSTVIACTVLPTSPSLGAASASRCRQRSWRRLRRPPTSR